MNVGVETSNDDLDPRINIELEKLNTAMEEINRLEIQIEDANICFRKLLNESTDHLKFLAKNISGNIEKSRPYFEALEFAKKARADCIQAANEFRKSNEIYIAAKETENLAELQFKSNEHEWKFDSAWQEMLNHAIIKVQNAENLKSKSARYHQEKAEISKKAEFQVSDLEKQLKRNIQKAQKYFDEKKLCDEKLNYQKERITMMEKLLHHIKESYSNSLKNLERISEEIHAKRRRDSVNSEEESNSEPPTGPREPGVGAEFIPNVIDELNKNSNCSHNETRKLSPTYEELLKLKLKIRELATRPVEYASNSNSNKLIWESELNETINQLDSMLLLQEQKYSSLPHDI